MHSSVIQQVSALETQLLKEGAKHRKHDLVGELALFEYNECKIELRGG